jgi:hypothetical protein
METEVIILTSTLAISIIGNIGASFYWAGKIKAKIEEISKDLGDLDIDNKAAHKTIYSSQEAIGRSAAMTEEHLKNINGSVNRNTNSIDSCKAEIQKNTERIFTHTHGKS